MQFACLFGKIDSPKLGKTGLASLIRHHQQPKRNLAVRNPEADRVRFQLTANAESKLSPCAYRLCMALYPSALGFLAAEDLNA